MRQQRSLLVAAAAAGAVAALAAPRGALAFAPPSARTSASPGPAIVIAGRAYVPMSSSSSTHTRTNTHSRGTVTSLSVLGSRKDQAEREILQLRKEIRSLEGNIRREEEYNPIISLATGLFAAAAVFFVVDGNACPACAEAFPDAYNALQESDLVLAARSSLPPVVADFLYDLGDAFGYAGQVVGKIFELLYMVLMAILPILGKAAIAAFNAAIPAIQKGLAVFFDYVGQAARDSTEAVKPYVGEASTAAQPYLNEVGNTAKGAADTAGSAVTVKVAPILTQVEEIKSAADSVATSISGKVTSVTASVPVPSAATVEQVKEAAKSAAESVTNAVEAAKASVETSGATATPTTPPVESSVAEVAKSAAASVTNAVEAAKTSVEASGAATSTPPVETPVATAVATSTAESVVKVVEAANPSVEVTGAVSATSATTSSIPPPVETSVAAAAPAVEQFIESAKEVGPPPPTPIFSPQAVSQEVSSATSIQGLSTSPPAAL
mmetsp:Transcript_4617/g.13060  ORF Transcript_4617/g.13060 Transcript_4617/m.13060 type:complete len:496 (+) Transcript_4617:77-1564(+)